MHDGHIGSKQNHLEETNTLCVNDVLGSITVTYCKDMSSSTNRFHLDFKSWYAHRSWSFSMTAVFHGSLFPLEKNLFHFPAGMIPWDLKLHLQMETNEIYGFHLENPFFLFTLITTFVRHCFGGNVLVALTVWMKQIWVLFTSCRNLQILLLQKWPNYPKRNISCFFYCIFIMYHNEIYNNNLHMAIRRVFVY